jgi:hypothetical protein
MKNQAILATAIPTDIEHMVAKNEVKMGVKSLLLTGPRHQDHHEVRTNNQQKMLLTRLVDSVVPIIFLSG